MNAHTAPIAPGGGRRGASWLLLALTVLAVVVGAPAGAAGDEPVVGAYVDDRVELRDAGGALVGSLPVGGRFALFGDLLTADTANGIAGYDGLTGERRWRVRNARIPIATGGGVFFAPDAGGVRDPQNNSIWLRRAGRVRKAVQFANGPGLPGYDPGMEGENGMLSWSLDRRGRTLVVAQGNDVDLFIYDIFAVDVTSGEVTRLTSGLRSRWPAVSADGSTVAYQRDKRECGAPFIRAADLLVVSSDGGEAARLFRGSCRQWLHNPRWVSPTEVVAFRSTVAGGSVTTDLVLVDVTTGERRRLTRTGDIAFFSTNPRTGLVAYETGAAGGYTLLDLPTNPRTTVAQGDLPHLNGDTTLL